VAGTVRVVGRLVGWWIGLGLGVGDLEGGVGEEFGVPAGAVEQMVMAGAEQHQVARASTVARPRLRAVGIP
jgi:hypothetical protein